MSNKYKNTHALELSKLSGKILVAMPYMQDARFHQSIIYICGHDANGSMGIIINKYLTGLSFHDLLKQVDITIGYNCMDLPILYGGPVDIRRGFVLHSLDYAIDSTVFVDDQFGVTSTLEILKALSRGEGPKKKIVALGYAGWTAGQLEKELGDNGWLVVDANEHLIFNAPVDEKWRTVMASIGVNPAALALECGHA